MNRTGEHRVTVKEDELARPQGIPRGTLCGTVPHRAECVRQGSPGPWVMCARENQGC